MTRIFTDSVASALHYILSAFIRVYLRLIFVSLSDRTRQIKFELSLIFIKMVLRLTARFLNYPNRSAGTNLISDT